MSSTITNKTSETLLRSFCSVLRTDLNGDKWQKRSINPTRPGGAITTRDKGWQGPGKKKRTSIDSPLALGVETVARLSGTPDKTQKEGFEEWNKWYEDNKSFQVRDWKRKMQNLAEIFSKIFFLDKLKCALEFNWDKQLSGDGGPVYGKTTHPDHNSVHIRMDNRDHSVFKKIDHHADIISTFIRELICGHLFCFCCEGAVPGRSDVCRWSGDPGNKGDGRFFGWFIVACKIDLCMKDLINIDGHCFSLRAAISHSEKGGKISAGDWLLFFTLFNWSEIAKLFDYLDSSAKERISFRRMLQKENEVAQVWAELGEKNPNKAVKDLR
ncbi:uncharacterized protein RCC_08015 [Ramularia collo-cygni]|uniref:Uncharacterized protein n=1 Tax=Ramularia collo-cygni TaxID=112498 RepID=A0A2D3VE70_9PEZI|nr:uncharacterized protein RCC_08015 [Ramularia collo-cygni]CZT22146.1 uncharacterized protein RCC_08015 [Ramularia collo-cygni]